MQIVPSLDPDVWHAFVEQHPQGQVFSTRRRCSRSFPCEGASSYFMAVVEADQNWRCCSAGAGDAVGRPAAAAERPRAVVYGSVLYELSFQGRGSTGTAVARLRQAARWKHCLRSYCAICPI